VDYLKMMNLEVTQKSTGDFLRWVVNDIAKEEKDTIELNNFDAGKINSAISNKARKWFFNYINSNF